MWRRLLLSLLALCLSVATLQSADRPNILWITVEDMSPTLGCYGDKFANTPHLDRFAAESVLYTNAFATAPVCSPSRSCLINGAYAPTQGTHNMRSAFPLPAEMRGFPSRLRKVGYFTSNNVKTDYNSGAWKEIIEASWDENSADAHWRSREQKQPFFSIFNLMTTHQSRTMVWPYDRFASEIQGQLNSDQVHDPSDVPLPPYYPDTSVIRKTVARYYDCVTVMDKQVGDLLQQLEDDGLVDDTIVFFYSDHGSGMPRHKRALLDSGMQVALMVRFPKKYQHLAPAKPGSQVDRLVSFVDFGPTALSLAGVEVPKYMQGKVFLGQEAAKPREYVFGHRDRVDEVIDCARSVRDKRYLYIRNFMPHLGYNQPTAWPDLGEIRHEFYRLADTKTMSPAQWHFAGPARPAEELYDCQADPQNLNNLADSPEHTSELERLRKALRAHMLRTRDLGFLPEPEAWKLCGKRPLMQAAANNESYDLPAILDAVELVGRGSEEQLLANLSSPNASVRYWAAVGMKGQAKLSTSAMLLLRECLNDESVSVRIEAAMALTEHGHADEARVVLIDALSDDNLTAVLVAARAIELLDDKDPSLVAAMQAADKRAKQIRPADTPATVVQPGDIDMAMFIGFSTNAYLSKLKRSE